MSQDWLVGPMRAAGELFAECPVPTDHRPLLTAVEPVVDSSRYFVLRIVDRDSQRHAFIGAMKECSWRAAAMAQNTGVPHRAVRPVGCRAGQQR